MSEVPYIEEMDDMGRIRMIRLNPTGRWKLESGPYWTDRMFVEHKGWIFRRWISETQIRFCKTEVAIFDCKSEIEDE